MIEKIPKTISYSSIITYHNCPRLYYINYILGIRPYESTIYTIYGKLIHKYCQDILLGKIQKEEAIKKFIRTWERFCGLYKNNLGKNYDFNELEVCGTRIIEDIQSSFMKQFGIEKANTAEENLYCELEKYPQKFTGFIDLTLGNKTDVVLVDFKIVASAFMYKKFKDKFKDYQLVLYKYFYAQKHNIEKEKIKLYFCLLERTQKSKNLIHFLEVPCGKIKVNNALNLLNETLFNIDRKFFIPKRSSCNMYNRDCLFKNTEYCK